MISQAQGDLCHLERKHRPTGKPRGGSRPGTGRPPGSTNALELGEVKALKSLRWRVPDEAPKEVAEVADEAFQALVDVMRERPMVGYDRDGRPIALVADRKDKLKAALALREEVCGPVARKVEVTGKLSLEQLLAEATKVSLEEVSVPTAGSIGAPPPIRVSREGLTLSSGDLSGAIPDELAALLEDSDE